MSKKGGDVPPPDPQLVQAQLKSMGIQDAAITQVMQLANEQAAQNRELMPIQKESMQFGLDSAKTAYAQSQSDRGWLLGRRDQLTGLQDKMTADAAEFNTPAAEEKAANAAQADVTQAIDNTQAASARQMAAMGVNPASGRFAGMNSQINVDKARLLAGAANAGRLQGRNEGRMLTDRATNSLAGYPAQSMAATGQGAQISASGIGIANAGAGGVNAGYGAMTNTVGTGATIAAQMGSNATGMYGQQSNAYMESQKQKSEGAGAIIGGVATVAAAVI